MALIANTIIKILQNIASFSSLLPLILFFIFQRNNRSKELGVISFYLTYCVLNDIIAYYFFQIVKQPIFFVYDIFAVVEFCFFSWYFYLVIHNAFIKRLIPPLVIAFCLFSISLYLFIKEGSSFSSILVGIESVLIIAMCIYYFFDQLKQPNTFLIYSSIHFWIIISFLIYLSGTFFLYIYADSMMNDKEFVKQYVLINSSFIILKSILLGIAMTMSAEKTDNRSGGFPDTLDQDWNATRESLHNLN